MQVVIGVGIDLVDVDRFKGEGERGDIFTPDEIAYCASKHYPARHFAARFAAKEAFLKALGTGARTPGEFLLVEVIIDEMGAPELVLKRAIKTRSEALGVTSIKLSLTHTETTAAAVVVVEG